MRSPFSPQFWLAAIIGGLVAVPVALSAATASADPVNWDAIAQCESGGNWSSASPNGHYGGLQFSPETWAAGGGVGSPADATPDEQIRVAQNVMRLQGLSAWPTCGSRGNPVLWGASTGCHVMPGGVLGLGDLQRVCTALVNGLAGLGPLP